MDFFLDFLLSAVVTVTAYLSVPIIVSFAYKGALSKKTIIIITIVNGLVVWFLFRIVQAALYDNLPAYSSSMAPASIWSTVAYSILKATRYNIGLFPNVCDALHELDEARNHFGSIKFNPIYSYVSEHLKSGRWIHEKALLSQQKSPRQYAYQMIYDAADRELHEEDHIPGYMERHQPFYQEVKNYALHQMNADQPQIVKADPPAKIVSDAEVELQNLKTQREALPDGPETAQTGSQQAEDQARPTSAPPATAAHREDEPKTRPAASAGSARRPAVTADFSTEHMQAASPFGNAMEALVELSLAKCQHQSEAFQPIYQKVKQRLQEDLADTEAQIRHAGKTPKEYVYQMIIDEIDHQTSHGACASNRKEGRT